MKQLLSFIIPFLWIILIASDDKDSEYYESGLHLIKSTLPDSLLSIIDDKPMILYMSGHHAHIWSIVLKDGNKYEVLCGRIDPFGINKLYESTESSVIDTTAFIYSNREFISWGFDSLESQSKRIKYVDDEVNNPFSGSLSIIKNNSVKTIITKKGVVDTGVDSADFRKKSDKLLYLMYWLAEPFVRKYTPDSIYIKSR